MLSLLPENIETYVGRHRSAEPEIFRQLRKATMEHLEYPEMQIGWTLGQFLHILVKISGASRILEVGTYSGYSALSMASALPETGRLITCEISSRTARFAQRFFNKSDDGKKIEIRIGDATATLSALSRENALFDMAFIDADKPSYTDYWEAIVPLIRSGGLILADNTLWQGRVLQPQSEADYGIVNFNHHVRSDTRVEHTLLSIRDGLTIARKR